MQNKLHHDLLRWLKLTWTKRDKKYDRYTHIPNRFIFAKVRQPTGQTFLPYFQRNLPIFFKPKLSSHSRVLLENAKKNMVFHFGVDAMPLSLKNLLLRALRMVFYLVFCSSFERIEYFNFFWDLLTFSINWKTHTRIPSFEDT